MKSLFLRGAAVVCVLLAISPAGAMNVKEATKACAPEISAYCVSATCPMFCSSSLKGKKIPNCKTRCTATDLCNPKSKDWGGDAKELATDCQTKEIACVAQKRAPTSGYDVKTDGDWKTRGTYTIKSKL